MMKFKDEQGNFVTPRKGDYVLASDIKDEEMHNRVREAFECSGCKVDVLGRFGGQSTFTCLSWLQKSHLFGDDGCLSWSDHIDGYRRIIPHQKTLFEAACEAEDGARFEVGRVGLIVIKRGDECWDLRNLHGDAISWSYHARTDFKQLPSGSKKRDVGVSEVVYTDSVNFPADMHDECIEAFKLIGRLMQWEGAQIGKSGFTINPNLKEAYYLDDVFLPHEVTFETAEQCEAAWKAECPEMFNE